jgi:hypothetical protein
MSWSTASTENKMQNMKVAPTDRKWAGNSKYFRIVHSFHTALEENSPTESKVKLNAPMKRSMAKFLVRLSRAFRIENVDINQPNRAAKKNKPAEMRYMTLGQDCVNAEEGEKCKNKPVVRHPAMGRTSHKGIFLSRLFCTIGFVIISSTKCTVSES